jgi:1-acyl-sn-glycerol-3-phosphate acyltransferase
MPNKTYSTLSLFLRSLIFSAFVIITVIPYSFVVLVSWAFPLRYRNIIIRSFLRASLVVLKYVCHIEYKIEGLENIPKDRAGIVMSKHQSTWETFFLPLIFHDPAPIAKKELLWVPFFGWGLAASKPIVIDRKKKKSAMQQVIEEGRVCLEAGRWIIVFPEGTRVVPGTVGQYKKGGARLAAATGYPIIPVAHNAGRCWPRRQFIKQPGVIRIVIGPAIESEGRTSEQLLALTKEWIEGTMTRIDSLIYKSTG